MPSWIRSGMPNPAVTAARTDLAARLAAFVLERFPFALPAVQRALSRANPQNRDAFRSELTRALSDLDGGGLPDPTPRVSATARLDGAVSALLDTCDGFLARDEIAMSLTADERR